MKIELLRSYFENRNNFKKHKNSNARGLDIQTIEKMEAILNKGKPFPKAFRELLFIGGDFEAIGIGPGYDIDWELENGDDYLAQMDVYKKLMQEEGLSLDRPYVIFNEGCDSSFDFIYLDEGDDPRPRFFYLSDNLKGDDPRIGNFPEKTFSELIDRLVDHALRGLVPF